MFNQGASAFPGFTTNNAALGGIRPAQKLLLVIVAAALLL
jgi:hypothetical protein